MTNWTTKQEDAEEVGFERATAQFHLWPWWKRLRQAIWPRTPWRFWRPPPAHPMCRCTTPSPPDFAEWRARIGDAVDEVVSGWGEAAKAINQAFNAIEGEWERKDRTEEKGNGADEARKRIARAFEGIMELEHERHRRRPSFVFMVVTRFVLCLGVGFLGNPHASPIGHMAGLVATGIGIVALLAEVAFYQR